MTNELKTQTRQDMLRRMLEIRITEEQIQELFLQNLIRGTTHLCIGQEACSIGVAWALQKGDTVTCTYRGHGHALALGMPIKDMMAEMMGKESGCCKGKGGSMHMTDASIGLLGANAIVGAQLPIAVGAALTSQVKNEGKVAVSFFGDGATNIGAFRRARPIVQHARRRRRWAGCGNGLCRSQEGRRSRPQRRRTYIVRVQDLSISRPFSHRHWTISPRRRVGKLDATRSHRHSQGKDDP